MCGCFLSIALGAIENHKKDNEKESETRSSMFICHENDSSTASVQKKKERKKENDSSSSMRPCSLAESPPDRTQTHDSHEVVVPVACHQQPDRGSRQRTPTAPTPTNPNTPRTPKYLRTPTPSGQTRARAVVQLKKSVLV